MFRLKIRQTIKNSNNEDEISYISPSAVKDIFKRISPEDARFMGFDYPDIKPEYMILSVIPVGIEVVFDTQVPPIAVRPSVMLPGSTTLSEDDITFALANILKANMAIKGDVRIDGWFDLQQHRGKKGDEMNGIIEMLQVYYSNYIDNERAGVVSAVQKNKRPLKTFRQRIKGKTGRVRGNLMGKRVNFSGRSVITADPTIDIDEVGVPRSLAKILTFPERVTRFNIKKLTELVARKDEWPGAKYYIDNEGIRHDLHYVRGTPTLKEGMIVERHINNGDIVLFNRQPSLHKMSIMGHRVRVLDYSTFRLNLSCTTPYNADFDGDEMNIHVPQVSVNSRDYRQTVQARAEVTELMMVHKNIISPKSNCPVMGIVQDTLLGSQKLTQRDTFIPRDMMMNMLMWVDDFDGVVPIPAIMMPQDGKVLSLWTGKQMYSFLLPVGV